MSNKKFWLIFFILIILPTILILPVLLNADPFGFNYYKHKNIVFVSAIVAFISSLYLCKNFFSFKQPFNFIGILALAFLLITFFVLYSIYSLSHFGF